MIREGCVLGIGPVVAGVSLPPGRYVGHQEVVDTQEKADALPEVDPDWSRFRDELLEVNAESAGPARDGNSRLLEPIATSDEDKGPC